MVICVCMYVYTYIYIYIYIAMVRSMHNKIKSQIECSSRPWALNYCMHTLPETDVGCAMV